MVTYSDPEAVTKAALSELSIQSDRLLPTEWASLQLAQRHVFEHLMINHGEAYVANGADQYATMYAAEDCAAGLLIRAFSPEGYLHEASSTQRTHPCRSSIPYPSCGGAAP